MNVIAYTEKIKALQTNLLYYIDDEKSIETNFDIFKQYLNEQKIQSSCTEFKLFLCLLSKIANNHHRNDSFYKKIEKILHFYHNEINNFFTSSELFEIFKNNKKILLFLINSELIKIDKNIVAKITSNKYKAAQYPQYFYKEINQFLDSNQKIHFDPHAADDFEDKRQIGENDSYVSSLIRKDLVEEFITHVNKTSLSLKTKIKSSIFETNPFLIENDEPTLIQYAAFFGAIQIFQYLQLNKVQLTSSLWLYAIHGCNSEIIHILEDNHIDPPVKIRTSNNDEEEEEEDNEEKNNKYKDCLKESIMCHHNDIANYIIEKYYMNEKVRFGFVFSLSLKYYNFAHIKNELVNKSSFYELCKYGYYSFVDILLNNENDIDINQINQMNEINIQKQEIDKLTDEKIFSNPKSIPVIRQKIRLNTPLYSAIKKQHFDVAKLLLRQKSIDVNILNKGLTVEAPANIKLYPNEIKTQNTAFNMAVEVGNIDLINSLLSIENINVNKCRIYDDLHKWGPGPEQGEYITEKPPLFIALEKGNEELYKLLLSNEKIDVNIAKKFTQMNPHGIFENFDVDETTLLNIFIKNQDIENIKLLLQNNKIDVNTPNTYSTYSQYTQIFRGRQTVGKQEKQKMAIQIAIENENIEIIKLLLQQKNIDLDIEDENGFDLIESIKNSQIKQLIADAKPASQKEQQFVIEPICTFEASGDSMIDQRFFICNTCGVNQHGGTVEGCCEVCARKCHKGHDIYCPSGVVSSFCDCPDSGKCCCNKHEKNLQCTGIITKGVPVNQPMYQCQDCGISGNSYICQNCAIEHHHGHKLIFKYKVKNGICCNYHPV